MSEYECFYPGCTETFDSLDEMVAVPGADDRDPRHFCEDCADTEWSEWGD